MKHRPHIHRVCALATTSLALVALPSCSGKTPQGGIEVIISRSCVGSGPGLSDCGENKESCCTSLPVPSGTYYRTYTSDGSGPTNQADPATVSSFRLDKYLVTVGRFRQFVNAVLPPDGGAGWLPQPGSGKHTQLNNGNGLNATGGGYEPGWIASDDGNIAPPNSDLACFGSNSTWTNSPGTQDNLPINCVNWYEAYAFCIWDGGFLPSEAEWEFVAAGGSQQREYPWGSTDPGTANQYAIYGCNYPSGSSSCVFPPPSTPASTAPVGVAALGKGLWGQLDLAGNLEEWNLDVYFESGNTGMVVPPPKYVDPCVDCAYLTSTAFAHRVFRGGSSGDVLVVTHPWHASHNPPVSRWDFVGFRCARSAVK